MEPVTAPQLRELVERARAALPNAYAPYSDFQVAAAVLDDAGRIHLGVNVENVSYGLTNCAERVAVGTAIAAGAKRILAIGVTARRLHPISPCGACRQVLLEFAGSQAPVASDYEDGSLAISTVGELLPGAFVALEPT